MENQSAVDQLTQILDDLAAGHIDASEAVRRAVILESEPSRYTCASCRFFRGGCYAPGQPPRAESTDSVRCLVYEPRDERIESLPMETTPRNGSRMWK
jgi:hypothetical protein